jgi:hypothetical protein
VQMAGEDSECSLTRGSRRKPARDDARGWLAQWLNLR